MTRLASILRLAALTVSLLGAVSGTLARDAERSPFSRRDFDAAGARLSPAGRLRWQAYRRAIEEASAQPMQARARAKAASRVLDLYEYASDQEVWGVPEYWASPSELAGKGRGDCEDFAIAAFHLLEASGYPRDALRLGFSSLRKANGFEAHMVLLVFEPDGSGDPWVVDNAWPDPAPLELRADLQVIFSFDRRGAYLGWGSLPALRTPKLGAKWRAELEKAGRDGFR